MMEIRLKSAYLEPLFVCLCLLTVLGPANGATVVKVTEESEAVLPCFIRPERDITRDVFDWKKDGQEEVEVFFYVRGKHYNNGLTGQDEQFKGRVSHFQDQLQFSDASIKIRDTKLSDNGTYTCDYSPDQPNRQTFYIDLVVDCILKDRSKENIPGASLEPCVTLLDHTRDKAQLQCEVRRVSPKPEVKWQDSDGNILPAEEPQVTERGGSYSIILKTTVIKTDNYSCVVTQEEICHQVSDEITVNIHGPEPPKGFPTGWVFGAVLLGAFLVVVILAVLIAMHCITLKCKKGRKTKEDKLRQPSESNMLEDNCSI